MQVSNDRLAELIQQLRSDFDIAGESMMPEAVAALGRISDMGNALTELQSLRSAAESGVEEAANRMLSKINEARYVEVARPGDSGVQGMVCGIIATELTALFAAERAKHETRIAELNAHLQDAVNKVGEQAATIAKQWAVLEECSNVVWGEATNARMHSDLQGADQLVDLMNRIAALVAAAGMEERK